MPAAVSDTFYPILLSRTEEPVTEEELEAFFQRFAELADRANEKGEKYVVILPNDPSRINAAGRKKVVEVQRRHLTPARNDATLAAFVPVDNPVARGIFTVIGWIAPDLVRHVRFVPNLVTALEAALTTLEEHGTPFKGDLQALRNAIGV